MKKISEKYLYQGEWISLKELNYETAEGEPFRWEIVERKAKRPTVSIIAKLIPSERYILIKQYRHAIGKYTLGFPAGICDSEDIEREALKELKEETGYTGKIIDLSPPLQVNIGVMDDIAYVTKAEVDETLTENLNPVQRLEKEEDITVVLKKRTEIKKFLLEEYSQKTAVAAGLWSIFSA